MFSIFWTASDVVEEKGGVRGVCLVLWRKRGLKGRLPGNRPKSLGGCLRGVCLEIVRNLFFAFFHLFVLFPGNPENGVKTERGLFPQMFSLTCLSPISDRHPSVALQILEKNLARCWERVSSPELLAIPWTSQNFPKLPRKFLGDFPQLLSQWIYI